MLPTTHGRIDYLAPIEAPEHLIGFIDAHMRAIAYEGREVPGAVGIDFWHTIQQRDAPERQVLLKLLLRNFNPIDQDDIRRLYQIGYLCFNMLTEEERQHIFQDAMRTYHGRRGTSPS